MGIDRAEQRPWRSELRARAAALCIGFVLTLLLLAGVEGVCYALNHRTEANLSVVEPYLYEFSESLGYRLKPGAEGQAKKVMDGTVIFDVTYRADDLGRRPTPAPEAGASSFLLFFGCSYVFGEGLSEEKALPAQVAALLPDRHVYNYGFSGYGPQQLLAKLESGELRDEIEERDGTLVYVLMSHHVRRAIGSMRVWTQWGRHFPFYELDDDGTLSRKGSFFTGRPHRSRVYSLLGRDQILRYMGVDIPLRLNERHLAVTSAILEKARDVFHERMPDGEFYVIIYPQITGHDVDYPALKEQLKISGISVFDFSNLIDMSEDQYRIPYDGHPSAMAHARVAEAFVASLATQDAG